MEILRDGLRDRNEKDNIQKQSIKKQDAYQNYSLTDILFFNFNNNLSLHHNKNEADAVKNISGE